MELRHATGHIPTEDEKERDRLHVMGLYGALAAFTPDDAHQARIEQEDEEALWAARLADPIATDGEDTTPCVGCGSLVPDERLNTCAHCEQTDLCPTCEQGEHDCMTPEQRRIAELEFDE